MSRIVARHVAPLILCPVRATQVLSTTGFISRRFGLVGGLAVVALLAAVGHAVAADVETDITWHGDRAAHFVNSMMSQGSGPVDEAGVIVINCDETPD